MRCVQQVSADRQSCSCAAGQSRAFSSSDYDATLMGTCIACPGAVSLDGKRCVDCDGSVGPGQRSAVLRGTACACADNADGLGVIAERDLSGTLFWADNGTYVQRCIVCETEAIPDAVTGSCAPCPYPKILSDAGVCMCPGTLPGGVRCSNDAPIQRISNALSVGWSVASYSVTLPLTGSAGSTRQATIANSAALREHLDAAAEGCHDNSNRTACNALANLCVLQMYSR
jgi:Meckelin (Transmembrane protein 67)